MSGQTGAVVLAAGQSRRMGRPKMLLPWGTTTVIGQVVQTLSLAEEAIIIILAAGALGREIEDALRPVSPVTIVYNPDYEQGEMLSSLKTGLRAMPPEADAALVVLGDQPQIQVGVVNKVVQAYRASGARLVVPSYQMRRGHPWLVDRTLWPEILGLRADQTLRDFLTHFSREILYVDVDTPSVLKDLDTPEDYRSEKPA